MLGLIDGIPLLDVSPHLLVEVLDRDGQADGLDLLLWGLVPPERVFQRLHPHLLDPLEVIEEFLDLDHSLRPAPGCLILLANEVEVQLLDVLGVELGLDPHFEVQVGDVARLLRVELVEDLEHLQGYVQALAVDVDPLDHLLTHQLWRLGTKLFDDIDEGLHGDFGDLLQGRHLLWLVELLYVVKELPLLALIMVDPQLQVIHSLPELFI
mmetsp:Transcript_30801/g.30308  ORF Transcript_30801/g.30308 Transcript_30801/m.30308 type:complete len:210 (-) Transcript_30801:968-1597(-)